MDKLFIRYIINERGFDLIYNQYNKVINKFNLCCIIIQLAILGTNLIFPKIAKYTSLCVILILIIDIIHNSIVKYYFKKSQEKLKEFEKILLKELKIDINEE